VLPEPENKPPRLFKAGGGVTIARQVRFELDTPKSCIISGARPMLWTTVPEAAVNEHSDAGAAEHDVDLAPAACDEPLMQPVAKAEAMQGPTNL
jgi:hypothetical protein